MVEKMSLEKKSVVKPVSLYRRDLDVVDEQLNTYGEFSGFVRWCLHQNKLIERFKDER